jgi:hypothetical protein
VLGPAVDDVLGPGDDGESAGSKVEEEGMWTASRVDERGLEL